LPRERWLGLGPCHTIDLPAARERARQARQQLLDGVDPIDSRKAARAAQALAAAKAKTFRECAENYIAANEGAWKNAKHAAQWAATLRTYVYPQIGNLAVADIDTGLVLRCVEPIWRAKTEIASRVLGRVASILDWATVRRYRQGDNPARWKGHLEHVLPAKSKLAPVKHHAALPYREIPAFMAALRQRQGSAARALEFTILTAARTGEVIGARWSEIDLNAGIWVVPAGRMKGGKEHRVPLGKRGVELLQSLPTEDGNPLVFVGPRARAGLSNMALTSVLRRAGYGHVTTHGFRSTFMDWAHERTAFPKVVIDMALAHTVGDKTEAAYRRSDLLTKRRQLAEAWANYCGSPSGGNVLTLARA
jgi:integrase